MRAFADLLGEFSALAYVANILPNSSLVDVVFYRGLTRSILSSAMNEAVCAVNPSRVGDTFDVAALQEIVDTLKCEGLSLGDRKLQRRGSTICLHAGG